MEADRGVRCRAEDVYITADRRMPTVNMTRAGWLF